MLLLTTHAPTGPHAELADITVPVMQAYATRHGYALQVLRHEYCTASTIEFLEVLKLSLDTHDAVLTLGADVLIMNHRIRFEDISHAPVSLSREHNSWWPINNDVMIWRRNPSTIELIDAIISHAPDWQDLRWQWQQWLWNLLQDSPKARNTIDILPARQLQSTVMQGPSCFQLGDFALHFLGLPIDTKIKLATEFLPLTGDPLYHAKATLPA